jgi:EAL domain-containing protein (putative c-di-GMP-specific phosphodiesterase class I)
MKFRGYLDSVLSESTQFSSLRNVFFDGVTGLPTLPLVLESIQDMAVEQHRLGILYLDTARLYPLEEEYGWEFTDRLRRQIGEFLQAILPRYAPLQVLPVHRTIGDQFLLIVSSMDPEKPVTEAQLLTTTTKLEETLNQYLASRLSAAMLPFGRMFVGSSVLEYNSNVRFERLLSRAIDQAFQNAVQLEQSVFQMQVRQLTEILNTNRIRTFFQPIFHLENLDEVLGHESLSRGPAGTPFESADFMFSLAGNCGLLDRLENVCQQQLISSLQKYQEQQLLFINLEPCFLENQQYRELALFNNDTVQPGKVVVEITERVAINDYEVVSLALDDMRRRGFRVAVDDVGSGYASLESIAYLKPDFIKINEKMTRGISNDYIKQEIVKTLRDLGARFSARLIAEGIENPEDMNKLRELNIPFGQGFLLQRPAPEMQNG